MEVTSATLDDFKKVVEEHGISADAIIINQNNGTEQAPESEGELRERLLSAGCVFNRRVCSRRSRSIKMKHRDGGRPSTCNTFTTGKTCCVIECDFQLKV